MRHDYAPKTQPGWIIYPGGRLVWGYNLLLEQTHGKRLPTWLNHHNRKMVRTYCHCHSIEVR